MSGCAWDCPLPTRGGTCTCKPNQPAPLTLDEYRRAALTLATWAQAEHERAEQLADALAKLAQRNADLRGLAARDQIGE